MHIGKTALSTVLALSLVACGGGGGSGGGPIAGGPGSPAPSPTPTPGSQCSVSERQDWVLQQLNEWYLFPDLLDTTVNKANHSTVQSYIDALVAPARAVSRDRFFTYITSIEEENAFFNAGANIGFGVRLAYDTANNRVFVIEAFENAPALGAGIDRGTEILAIGTSSANLVAVSTIMASDGPGGVINALGPSTAGTTRVLRIRDSAGVTREVSVTKAEFALDPVSDRYGARVIDDGGKKVGYINLRTFIDTARADLRAAFNDFRAQGVSEVIVDVRYNGGGLVSVAELMGDLMGSDKVGQVFSHTTFRASKAANNQTDNFRAQPEAIAATRIAFIGRGGTASASELVANSFIPYLGTNMALVGTNTFGKPVGQIGIDRAACDDRLRPVTFKTENRDRQGEYYTGLASVVPVTCRASDDITAQLGDPNEASVQTALDFLAGRACTAISSGTQGTQAVAPRRELLQPRHPTPAQREVPGLF